MCYWMIMANQKTHYWFYEYTVYLLLNIQWVLLYVSCLWLSAARLNCLLSSSKNQGKPMHILAALCVCAFGFTFLVGTISPFVGTKCYFVGTKCTFVGTKCPHKDSQTNKKFSISPFPKRKKAILGFRVSFRFTVRVWIGLGKIRFRMGIH
jgi:hypothetical protein